MKVEENVNLSVNKISRDDFLFFKNLIYDICGIMVTEQKTDLLLNRLNRRISKLKLSSISEYRKFLKNDISKVEITNLINTICTNKTDFFREPQHFDFLTEYIIANKKNLKELYIWSAPCSSGEEAYSISILLNEIFEQERIRPEYKILATDIDTEEIERAEKGFYSDDRIIGIKNKYYLTKYFDKKTGGFQVKPKLKKNIYFRYVNLINDYPFTKMFDIVFCRNVLIYFDKKTQENVLNRIYTRLKPNGYLFVGHSESITNLNTKFKYIKPAVYMKN